jgi:hypothetical protein
MARGSNFKSFGLLILVDVDNPLHPLKWLNDGHSPWWDLHIQISVSGKISCAFFVKVFYRLSSVYLCILSKIETTDLSNASLMTLSLSETDGLKSDKSHIWMLQRSHLQQRRRRRGHPPLC